MKPTIIVTGSPRSGTSMMMNMLEDGGISCSYRVMKVMNNLRNYNGNFEGGVIPSNGGVAVKKLGMAAMTLPEGDYYFINMDRPVNEIMSSWASVNKGVEPPQGQAERIQREKDKLAAFLIDKKTISFNYNDIVKSPDTELARLATFLPYPFDTDKAKAVINQAQYVDRSSEDVIVPTVDTAVITTPQVIPEETPKTPEQIAMENIVATLAADRDKHIDMVNEQIRKVRKNFEDTQSTTAPVINSDLVPPPVI